MSDRFDELVMQMLKQLQEDNKAIDAKLDSMLQIHVRNTDTLEEHERRSTASEKRIQTLEERELARNDLLTKLKGFLWISSLIGGTIAAFFYFIKAVVEMFTFFK
jgi:hypothetical protein